MKKQIVLSLFDGMSCGQIAHKILNIPCTYYSSEIDKHAIKVTNHNFPKTIQLGDITNWKNWDIPWNKINLILAGSPCQGFSFAGKQLAFDDPRSKLFFVFLDILNFVKSKNTDVKFLLENVKMTEQNKNVISRALGIAPIEINSALVSAQNRVRYYWTNIYTEKYGLFNDLKCLIPQPKDRNIILKDILENEVSEKYFLSEKMLKYFANRAANFNQGKINIRNDENKASCLTSSMMSSDISDNFISIDCNGKEDKNKEGTVLARYASGPTNFGSDTYIKIETNLKKSPNQNKANCFTAGGNSGGLHSDMTLIVASRGRNPENPKSRISGLNTKQILEPRNDGKTNCLTSVQKDNLVMQINPSKESGGVQPYQQNRIYDIKGIAPALSTDHRSAAILIPESTKKGYVEIKPGECFDGDHINSKTRRGRKLEHKSNALLAKKTELMQFTENFKIRRLTPIECKRLQTVPDWYDMSIVSDTQQYRMLGNGWTVEVIIHILKHLYT